MMDANELLNLIFTHQKECKDAECCVCGMIECPHNEPLHRHHDGCPVCSKMEDDDLSGEVKAYDAISQKRITHQKIRIKYDVKRYFKFLRSKNIRTRAKAIDVGLQIAYNEYAIGVTGAYAQVAIDANKIIKELLTNYNFKKKCERAVEKLKKRLDKYNYILPTTIEDIKKDVDEVFGRQR